MVSVRRSSLTSFVRELQSAGRIVFSADEAAKALRIGRGAFLDAAERLQRSGYLVNPRRGFYIVVPPQFFAWGAPPPPWYIDDLMRHEGRPYYVGLLKAAELHGATHQAVMEFQVVTDKRLPEISIGRSILAFYYRKEMNLIAPGVESRKTETGQMKVSSVELTALDLLRYRRAAGGLDNIVTVLSELAPKVDAKKLAALSASFERPVVQRLGYLLDQLHYRKRAESLLKSLSRNGSLEWVELDPTENGKGDLASEPVERDDRWRVIVRRVPEGDE